MDYEITAFAPEFEIVADSYRDARNKLEGCSDYIRAITKPRFEVDVDVHITDEVPTSSSPTIKVTADAETIVEYAI